MYVKNGCMKKWVLCCSAGLFLLINVCFGQTKNEKAVSKCVEELRLAMINGDSAMLDNLTASKLSYGHSSGHIDDKKQFVSKLASGVSDFVTMDLTAQTIAISGKTAIVRHKLDAAISDNKKPGEVHLLVMLIWQKQHGKWKLLARQAVKQPQP